MVVVRIDPSTYIITLFPYIMVQYNSTVPVPYGTVQYSTDNVPRHTVRYGTFSYGTVQYESVRYGTGTGTVINYGTVRYGTVRYLYCTLQLTIQLTV